jgi:hypothetical protein
VSVGEKLDVSQAYMNEASLNTASVLLVYKIPGAR